MKKTKRFKKGIYLRLFLFGFLIISNTLAWFIYVTRVDSDVSVHVKSWDVMFQSGDQEITNTVQLDVDDLYPGMEDYLYQISAYNRSEVTASFSYTFLEANVLGTEYITVEGRNERGETPTSSDLTSKQLENKFKNDYPFKLGITVSENELNEADGMAILTIRVYWAYESNNDELDTEWGIAAANYKKEHSDLPSITLKIKIEVTQNNE